MGSSLKVDRASLGHHMAVPQAVMEGVMKVKAYVQVLCKLSSLAGLFEHTDGLYIRQYTAWVQNVQDYNGMLFVQLNWLSTI